MKSIPELNTESHRQLLVGEGEGIVLGAQTALSLTVFSTPSMILLMELTANDLLTPHLQEGEATVGVTVDIKHLAPTPLGTSVRATAKLVAMDKKLFDFEVVAFDEWGEIGRGMHRRAVVSLPKFHEGLDKRTGPRGLLSRELPSVPSGKCVLWSLHNGVATVTLNREAKLNAIDAAMTSDLERALDYLEHPDCPARVVVLTGAGRGFCAGEDIKENVGLEPARSFELASRRGRICQRISHLPQPVIARVHGACMGGGLALALSADWILSSHAGSFAMPEIKLGWPPAYALDALLSRVGRSAALRITLMGEALSASEALQLGLVDEVLALNQLDAQVARLTQKLVQLPRNGLKETKHLLWSLGPGRGSRDLDSNLAAYNRCRSHPNAKVGMEAFLSKSVARFE